MSANLFVSSFKSTIIEIGYEQQAEGGEVDSSDAIRCLIDSNDEAKAAFNFLTEDEQLIVETKMETVFDNEFGDSRYPGRPDWS